MGLAQGLSNYTALSEVVVVALVVALCKRRSVCIWCVNAVPI
jgi:hypothetical protein